MKKYILCSVLISLFRIGSIHAQCFVVDSLLSGFNFNGHSYQVVKVTKAWMGAAACAKDRGGYLAEIESDSESQAIWQKVTSMNLNTTATTAPDGGGAAYLWIGGTDKVTEGTWKWDGTNNGTGNTFYTGKYPTGTAQNNSFINWGNEPDDYGTGQDGLGLALTDWPLGTASHWNDIDLNNTLYFLIEYNNLSMGIREDLKNSNYKISYLPEQSCVSITCGEADTYQVRIIDVHARQLKSETFRGFNHDIKLNDLSTGNYFVQIESVKGNLHFTQKISINK